MQEERPQEMEILTADDIAERLKITARQVYALARRGEMPSFRIGKYVRFCWNDVLGTIKKRRG